MVEGETVEQRDIWAVVEGLIQICDALSCVGIRKCVEWNVESIVNDDAENPSVFWFSSKLPGHQAVHRAEETFIRFERNWRLDEQEQVLSDSIGARGLEPGGVGNQIKVQTSWEAEDMDVDFNRDLVEMTWQVFCVSRHKVETAPKRIMKFAAFGGFAEWRMLPLGSGACEDVVFL